MGSAVAERLTAFTLRPSVSPLRRVPHMPRFLLFLLLGGAGLALAGMWLALTTRPHPAATSTASGTHLPAPPAASPVTAAASPVTAVAKPRVGVDPLNFTTPIAQPTMAADPATLADMAGKPIPPTALTGFWTMPASQQVAVVTAMEGDAAWSPSVRAFLRLAIQDRSLAPITRNNIANGLLHQQPVDTTLDRLFAQMAADPLEGPVWRDYAVQFLSQAFDSAPDQRRVEAELMGFLAQGVGSQPATAALHLHQLEQADKLHLGPAFNVQVVAMASNPAQPEMNRVTALALLAERRVPDGLTLARQAMIDAAPGLRRVGAGSLGLLGTAEDVALLDAACTDRDASVVRAATMAKDALNKRMH